MAARHKYADNGVDVDTVLEVADLETICATAAAESTGDLWKGSQRIDLADSGDGWRVYEIRPARLLRQVLLNFAVEVREMNGRRTLTSTIRHYRTTQPTVLAFIPAGPKSMVAHHDLYAVRAQGGKHGAGVRPGGCRADSRGRAASG